MEISGGITASLSGRYAAALYELASERGVIAQVESDLGALSAALNESGDLARLLVDPEVKREASGRAIAAVADLLGLQPLTRDFLGVLAANRRLATLGDSIASFGAIAAAARGEVTADVTTAHPLDAEQVAQITTKLAEREGRTVKVRTAVDPAILGGLVVRIGSREIDGSIRTRLHSLAQAMKG